MFESKCKLIQCSCKRKVLEDKQWPDGEEDNKTTVLMGPEKTLQEKKIQAVKEITAAACLYLNMFLICCSFLSIRYYLEIQDFIFFFFWTVSAVLS